MSSIVLFILYGIALMMGITSIALSYMRLPWNDDTEPLLAAGLVIMAIGSIVSIIKKRSVTQTPQTSHLQPTSQPKSLMVAMMVMVIVMVVVMVMAMVMLMVII